MFVLISYISILNFSCHQNAEMKSKSKIEKVHIVETEDDVDPPPPNLKSGFKNLHDWLSNICDSEKLQKPISEFSLGLFQSENEKNVVYLVGVNKNDNNETIDFKPQKMYFMLPKDDYNKLSGEKLIQKLTNELKDFTKTAKFQNSFLSTASSITFRGAIIWSK